MSEEIFVNTANEFALQAGENLPNHTASQNGQSRYVRLGVPGPEVIFRTKQQVYRLCVWLLTMAEAHQLANEPGDHTYDQVEAAIQNS